MVAIRRCDGSIDCSPFHVKMIHGAKKGDSRPKTIKIKVNGKQVSLTMKLGTAGEAFFIDRTHDPKIGRFSPRPKQENYAVVEQEKMPVGTFNSSQSNCDTTSV